MAQDEPHGPQRILIGTAGWSIPSPFAAEFNATGTHLQRYAHRMNCVEINSSFYRPHRTSTYARWAASTPPAFRFSVKAPRAITHDAELAPGAGLLNSFLQQVAGLGEKLGPLLFQLPPKQAFREHVADSFFADLRRLHPAGAVVLEPRHASWFAPQADDLLQRFAISRVQADPPPHPEAASPAGDAACRYYRLHGNPRIYYSSYTPAYLATLADILVSVPSSANQAWIIFDNTAAGEAMPNAFQLMQRINARNETQDPAARPSSWS